MGVGLEGVAVSGGGEDSIGVGLLVVGSVVVVAGGVLDALRFGSGVSLWEHPPSTAVSARATAHIVAGGRDLMVGLPESLVPVAMRAPAGAISP